MGMPITTTAKEYKPLKEVIRLNKHQFDPTGLPTLIPNVPSIPEEIQGLWYRKNQTFGIEFEITTRGFIDIEDISEDKWHDKAETLRKALNESLGDRVADKSFFEYHNEKRDFRHWNVEKDSSCGWEIITPILQNQQGFEEVVAACNVIQDIVNKTDFTVNFKTGTHIHIGWLGSSVEEIIRAIKLAKIFEPALGTLVSPSRLIEFNGRTYDINSPNEYCQPISYLFPETKLSEVNNMNDIWNLTKDHEDRYVSFNIKPLDNLHTVEVRLHNGTYESRKILTWLSLWMQILWAASQKELVLGKTIDRMLITPDRDIIELVDKYLPTLRKDHELLFVSYLKARRQQIIEIWEQHEELKPWFEYTKKWTL
ncbi:MAG: amidoligase family protein [candidate division WOR-3 bacterium]